MFYDSTLYYILRFVTRTRRFLRPGRPENCPSAVGLLFSNRFAHTHADTRRFDIFSFTPRLRAVRCGKLHSTARAISNSRVIPDVMRKSENAHTDTRVRVTRNIPRCEFCVSIVKKEIDAPSFPLSAICARNYVHMRLFIFVEPCGRYIIKLIKPRIK